MEAELTEAQTARHAADEALTRLEQALAQSRQEAAARADEVEERAQWLGRMETELTESRRELRTLRRRSSEHDDVVARAEAARRAMEAERDEAVGQMRALEAALDDTRAMVLDLERERDALRLETMQLRAEEETRRRDAEQRAAALAERLEAVESEGNDHDATWAAMQIDRLGAELEAARIAAARAGEAERERATLEHRLRRIGRIVEDGAAHAADMEERLLHLRTAVRSGGGPSQIAVADERLHQLGQLVAQGLAQADELARRASELRERLDDDVSLR
jgi:chromosome segregation ATPase